MTDVKKTKTPAAFDPQLLKRVSALSEDQLADFMKAAKQEIKKKKAEKKKSFEAAAGKIVIKFIKEIEGDKFPENFKKEILSIRDKIILSK